MSRRQRRRPATARSATAAKPPVRPRLAIIDGLRGLALCLMVVYHFIYDLVWFGVLGADFNNDPFWLGYRGSVVTVFLGLVGVSLVLARRSGHGIDAFWRRIAVITGCALLVSAASYVAFPQTFITFGVLHCIVVSSLLAQLLVDSPQAALVAGVAVVAAGNLVHRHFFDAPWLNWIGMMTHKPLTEDYVPIFPWLGVVLIGVAFGHWLLARERRPIAVLSAATPGWLAWMGRHSLLIYLLHQPVMIGILRVLL